MPYYLLCAWILGKRFYIHSGVGPTFSINYTSLKYLYFYSFCQNQYHGNQYVQINLIFLNLYKSSRIGRSYTMKYLTGWTFHHHYKWILEYHHKNQQHLLLFRLFIKTFACGLNRNLPFAMIIWGILNIILLTILDYTFVNKLLNLYCINFLSFFFWDTITINL